MTWSEGSRNEGAARAAAASRSGASPGRADVGGGRGNTEIGRGLQEPHASAATSTS